MVASAARMDSPPALSPLMDALYHGRVDEAQLLLARGGELNTPARNIFKVTALHAALAGPQPGIATLLIAAGADVNARQQAGNTPLHETAHAGLVELAHLLLDHGADPTARDDDGHTPADIARQRGHTAVLDVLEPATRG